MRKTFARLATSWGVAAVLALGGSTVYGASALDFQVLSYDLKSDGGTAEMPGRLYVPANIPAGETRPLVVFFHGVDERGSDNATQVNSNINGLLEAAKAKGFFLYAPQLDANSGSWSAAKINTAMTMVARATQSYAVDTSSLYVTGISLGGGGAKVAISNYRDTFAAAIPLSAVDPSDDNPALLAGKPIWLFHSVNDARVNVSASDNYTTAIRTADGKAAWTFPDPANTGAPYYPYEYAGAVVNADYYEENNLRYSRYTAGGHATKEWTKYYREAWLYDWMLAQKNPLQRPKTGQAVLFDLGATAQAGNDTQGRAWNSSAADQELTLAVAVPFARTTGGQRTTVSLSVTDKFAGVASRGITSGSPYAANVAQDTWTVAAGDSATIQLDGLTPGGEYKLVIFGSDSDSDGGRGRLTQYAVGSETRDLEIFNNVNQTAVFERVLANESGQLLLTVGVAGPTARFGGIGTLEITALPDPSGVAWLLAGPLLLLRRRRRGTT